MRVGGVFVCAVNNSRDVYVHINNSMYTTKMIISYLHV